MNFSSARFAVFLVVLLGLLAFPWGHSWKKRILTVASCLFYAAWDFRYLALLLFVSVVDYVIADRIQRTAASGRRRALLLVSLISNLGLLAYFKYTNFFLDNLDGILPVSLQIEPLKILLPAGISFYTFKTLSYTIDVYRKEIEPCRSLADYAMFVTFFPELIAGPIVRASVFLPQMTRPIGPTGENLGEGASRFLLGLTKKRLLADTAASIADPIFASPLTFDRPTVWFGVLAYAIQIYCDFSGYSDMAIGCARMIGYDLPENFNLPYLSADPSEFWRRWHITLSSWLRDYLYIPLGGNRGGAGRTYVNLALTMILGGLWHGASWNFVLWGTLHGGALALHRLYRSIVGKRFSLPNYLAVPATFFFVALCWIPFRAVSWATTSQVVRRMAFDAGQGIAFRPTKLVIVVAIVAAGHLVGSAIIRRGPEQTIARTWPVRSLEALGFAVGDNPISGWFVRLSMRRYWGAFCLTMWILVLYFFVPSNSSPFIYFQF